MVPAAPRDPFSIVESMQAELAELRRAWNEPGPLCPAEWVLIVRDVNAIAALLCSLKRTLRRKERETSHA